MAPRVNGHKRKPTRQPSLLKKPVIEVRGKIGKAQKSRKRKIKKFVESSVDYYEAKVDGRELTLRQDSDAINTAPKSLEQEIPKKLRELMRNKERLAENAKLSKRKRKGIQKAERMKQDTEVEKWFKRPAASTPTFMRLPGESDKAYYRRVEAESNDFVKIARFENENECKVTIKDDGNVEVVKTVKRKQIKNKEHRDKQKLKKQSKQEDKEARDFTDFRDDVQFNERIDRPPEQLAKPRKAKNKDGMGDRLSSFKFMNMVGQSKTANPANSRPDPIKSLASKERLMEERQRAIDLYRSIRNRKKIDLPIL